MTIKEKNEIQKNIVDSLPLKPHGRLLLSPRVGKTKIAVDIIKKNKPKSILWVTPLAKLAEEDIPKEFITWKASKYLKVLTTSTWASLNKVTGHYDMIILDEEQYSTINNMKNILNKDCNFSYIISMTGTETQHQDKKNIYNTLNLKVLYEMSINNAVDLGLLANYQIKVVNIPLGTEKNVKAGNKNKPFMTSESANYEYLHKMTQLAIDNRSKDVKFRVLARRRAILNSPSKLKVAKNLIDTLTGRKLFFCSSIEQAELLSVNTYHSKTDSTSLNKFINGDIDTITMVNAGGVGVTYKKIENLVIVQADSDKNGAVSQKIARTLLQQKNYKATIWILCLNGTQDEKWVKSTLESFDSSKIEFINF
jgi:superfamily II DNA or RNA helicase